jgi:spore coat polysaccharide biosynthesis predicted glycosyltransferase SpsG
MIIICIESSHSRGMGHLYRMCYLAAEMRRNSRDFLFVLNQDTPSLELLKKYDYPYRVVDLETENWQAEVLRSEKIDLWIDDRLATSVQHSAILRNQKIPIVTFDNSGAGAELADISIYGMAQERNASQRGARIFVGLEWNLIDPQIYRYRRARSEIHSLVITFGGTDTFGMTPQICRAVRDIYPQITVVTGPGFKHDGELRISLEERPLANLIWKKNVPSLAEEFSLHDLAITAGGVTPFEANAAGLPCIIVATELHEIDNARLLSSFGGSIYAGFRDEFDVDLVREMPNVAQMSQRAMASIPIGTAARVAREIEALISSTEVFA